MRKRTIANLVEHCMWTIIILLPLLMLLISPLGYSIGGGSDSSSLSLLKLSDIFNDLGISSDNIIYNSINDIFGSNGLIHIFSANSSMMLYFTYFIMVEVIHLMVDALLFIPRLAHKWMDKCTLEVSYDDK